MMKYTDTDGKHIILCDNCRCDILQGNSAFMLSPGKVAEGYVGRDYERGEVILCPAYALIVGQIMNLMGIKRADSLNILQTAA